MNSSYFRKTLQIASIVVLSYALQGCVSILQSKKIGDLEESIKKENLEDNFSEEKALKRIIKKVYDNPSTTALNKEDSSKFYSYVLFPKKGTMVEVGIIDKKPYLRNSSEEVGEDDLIVYKRISNFLGQTLTEEYFDLGKKGISVGDMYLYGPGHNLTNEIAVTSDNINNGFNVYSSFLKDIEKALDEEENEIIE